MSVHETWIPVPSWEGLYEVSDQGEVRSLPRTAPGSFAGVRRLPGKVLRPVKDPSEHVAVTLTEGDRRERHSVHRLVMRTFVGPCPEGMEVLHNNGDPTDNRLSNLRYGTRSDNLYDAVKHGDHWQAKKVTCPRGHALSGANVPKRARKSRECKACHRAHDYVRYHPELRPDLQKIADSYYEKIRKEAA